MTHRMVHDIVSARGIADLARLASEELDTAEDLEAGNGWPPFHSLTSRLGAQMLRLLAALRLGVVGVLQAVRGDRAERAEELESA